MSDSPPLTLPAPPAEASAVPRRVPSAGRRVRLVLEGVLVAAVILFGFLAASRQARNSDVYLHLAAGRLLAEGAYRFGDDPFTFTAESWVNHAWLFDLLFHGLYTLGGGVLLVIVKALAVAILAGVLLAVRRPDSGWLAPAGCTLLALLSMSPHLLLQPVCLSYLFLGLTLWLLWRGSSEQQGERASWKRHLSLLLLLALWANVDNWFLLGPLLVWLVCLSEKLQAPRKGLASLPTWLLPASLLACLLNPHGFKVFTLPLELSTILSSSGLADDPRFAQLGFASPWQAGLRLSPLEAFNLAECAYFLLVALGLLSFWLNRRQTCWWRVAVWGALALFGAWSMRTVPFFAVVAGPIASLNMQDWASTRRKTTERSASVPGLFALLASGVVLVFFASIGWLQGFTQQGRQAVWGLYEDPSLRRTAETIRRWRQQKVLGEDERAFAVHPDVAHYLAWFCPGERSFLDHRLSTGVETAREFEGVCRELNPLLAKGGRPIRLVGGWQGVFLEYGMSLLILYDPDQRMMLESVAAQARDERQWEILAVEGKAVVLGWKNAPRGPKGKAFAERRLDPVRLAFGPPQEDVGLSTAPGTGPQRPPRKRSSWENVFRPEAARPWESAASSVLLRWFDAADPAERERAQRHGWAVFGSSLSAVPARPEAGLGPLFELLMRLRNPAMFADAMTRSPALPLLAIRSARTALASDPDDLNAAVRLGQAYEMLLRVTPEQGAVSRSSVLSAVRHIQLVTPLEQALRVDPNLMPAHAALADLYMQRRYLDAALEHRKAQLRLARRDVGDVEARGRADLLDVEVQRLERDVQDRQNQFVIRSRSLRDNPLVRARMALDLGLAKRALDDVLLESNVLLFGFAGTRLELELLLMLGRADKAGELLATEEVQDVKKKLDRFSLVLPTPSGELVPFRVPAYEWFTLCQAAAVGDYDRASDMLREAIDFLEGEEDRALPDLRRRLRKALASEVGLGTGLTALAMKALAEDERENSSSLLIQTDWQRAGRFDLLLLAGLLDLERGQIARAEETFRQALRLAERDKGLIPQPSRVLAGTYQRFIQEQGR